MSLSSRLWSYNRHWHVVIWAITAAVCLWPVWQWGHRWWFSPLIILLLLLGFHSWDGLGKMGQAAWLGVALGSILGAGARVAQVTSSNIAAPPEWDFYLYWIYGRAAVLGLNPYEPQNLHFIAQPLNPSQELLAELFYFQTPPSLFLFAPLGRFDIQTAYAVWYALQMAALLACVVLLERMWLRESRWLGLALTTALAFLLRSTWSTLAFGQINFLILLLIILAWQYRDKAHSGIWLALSVLAKPVGVFLYVYWIARRQWRAIAASLLAFGAASLLTMVVFGISMFTQYLTVNPIINSMPTYLYNEVINQSLSATLLRLTRADLSTAAPLTQLPFLSGAALLTAVTVGLVWRCRTAPGSWAFALGTAYALLVFPKTLEHYSVLLLPGLLQLWSDRSALPGGALVVSGGIALQYLLVNYRSGEAVFVALLLHWCWWVVVLFWRSPSATATSLPAEEA